MAGGVPVSVRGSEHVVHADEPLVVPLGEGGAAGTRLARPLDEHPQLGGTRADGSKITAGVPEPIPMADDEPDPAGPPPTEPPAFGLQD